jgi:uncharacterized membrane protein
MNSKRKDVSLAGVGLVFGTAFGYLIGIYVIGNLGLGMALGAFSGLTLAPVIKRKETAA